MRDQPTDPSPASTTTRRIRALALIGLLGSAAMLLAAFATSMQWGLPGTPAYERYEAANRLIAFLIVPVVAAPVALGTALAASGRRGVTAMAVAGTALLAAAVGVAAEFFLFSTAPYQGSGSEGRLAAYLLFFVAGTVFLVAAGWTGWVQRGRPPAWVTVTLLVLPALGIALTLAGGALFFGIPVTAAGIALAADALRHPAPDTRTGDTDSRPTQEPR